MDNAENIEPRKGISDEGLSSASDDGPITVPQPYLDSYFTGNKNIIEDLICDEVRYHSLPAYCVYESRPQAIWMRRALLNWLREVCEHRHTESEVLAHTAQLIDRVVHIIPTDKREYQLVGAACFLISSKLKETIPVSVERMVQYTDFSVTKQDLLNKEVTIAISLQWDLSSISPIDFIAPTMHLVHAIAPRTRQTVRLSAVQIFMKILHVEGINLYLPGYTAAACILYALQLELRELYDEVIAKVAAKLQEILGLEARKFRDAHNFLLSLFKPGTLELSDYVLSVDMGPPTTEVLSQPRHFEESSPSTSTHSASGDHLSYSSVCSTTSSTGTSDKQPVLSPANQQQKLTPPVSKNVSVAGEPLNRDLPLSLSTVGIRASDRDEYWTSLDWTRTDVRETERV